MSRQSPKSLRRMPPPFAQNTSATPISEPPATTPDATGKVNSSATFGSRLSIRIPVFREQNRRECERHSHDTAGKYQPQLDSFKR